MTAVRTGRRLDLTDPGTVRAVARRCGLSLKHRLGQHFLIDRIVLERILEALRPESADVFEIGPGIGTLTAELGSRAARVVAVDLDPGCVRACSITVGHLDNVEVRQGDALRTGPAELGFEGGWLAAGNIPYNLTGAILSHLLERDRPPARAVLLVQREVAMRLSAAEREAEWSLATVAIRSLATVERVVDIAPGAFEPPPAVHSSLIRLAPARMLPEGERRAVLDLARSVFQLRRKTLRHGMTRALDGDEAAALHCLDAAGVDPGRRPGTLALVEWRELARAAAHHEAHQ